MWDWDGEIHYFNQKFRGCDGLKTESCGMTQRQNETNKLIKQIKNTSNINNLKATNGWNRVLHSESPRHYSYYKVVEWLKDIKVSV